MTGALGLRLPDEEVAVGAAPVLGLAPADGAVPLASVVLRTVLERLKGVRRRSVAACNTKIRLRHATRLPIPRLSS